MAEKSQIDPLSLKVLGGYQPFARESDQEFVDLIVYMTEAEYEWLLRIKAVAENPETTTTQLTTLFLNGLVLGMPARVIERFIIQAYLMCDKCLDGGADIKNLAEMTFLASLKSEIDKKIALIK